jgi:hypothetical protein
MAIDCDLLRVPCTILANIIIRNFTFLCTRVVNKKHGAFLHSFATVHLVSAYFRSKLLSSTRSLHPSNMHHMDEKTNVNNMAKNQKPTKRLTNENFRFL